MSDENKRVVEINGVKVEVDLRTARRVDSFKVGDAVKILIKQYSNYKSHVGVIVGFDEFKSLPTMVIAYLEVGTWEQPLKFAYLNSKSEDVEICPHEPKDIGLEKGDVLGSFEREIAKRETEITELKRKRSYFVEMFGRYFDLSEKSNTA